MREGAEEKVYSAVEGPVVNESPSMPSTDARKPMGLVVTAIVLLPEGTTQRAEVLLNQVVEEHILLGPGMVPVVD